MRCCKRFAALQKNGKSGVVISSLRFVHCAGVARDGEDLRAAGKLLSWLYYDVLKLAKISKSELGSRNLLHLFIWSDWFANAPQFKITNDSIRIAVFSWYRDDLSRWSIIQNKTFPIQCRNFLKVLSCTQRMLPPKVHQNFTRSTHGTRPMDFTSIPYCWTWRPFSKT